MHHKIFLAVTALLALAGLAQAKQPQTVATFTGSLIPTAYDVDPGTPGDQITTGAEIELVGTSKMLGNFSARGLSDIGEPTPPFTECDGDDFVPLPPPPFGIGSSDILLTFQLYEVIFTAANGDLLYTRMSEAPASTICFSRVGEPAVATVYLEIVGGTGRFEESSGELVLRSDIDPVGVISGLEGILEEN